MSVTPATISSGVGVARWAGQLKLLSRSGRRMLGGDGLVMGHVGDAAHPQRDGGPSPRARRADLAAHGIHAGGDLVGR